jgi:Xaa-Pro aminopeptidase
MFQTFDSVSDPSLAAPRVARLRERMAALGLDGFLVPRADEHQGEYVPARAERLQWLTGFTGSAGVALVLADSAHLFVDGRYTLQAGAQVDPALFSIESLVETPPPAWFGENAAKAGRIGYDPWLHTIADARALRAALDKAGGELVAVEQNLVDAIWDDQPGPPVAPVEIHPERFAGRLARDKLADLAAAIGKAGATHCVLTDPSSLAWAFNIRGADVPHTPLALGYAIVAAEGLPLLFLDKRKMSMEVEAYLTQLADIRSPQALEHDIGKRAGDGGRIGLDASLAADRLRMLVEDAGGTVVPMADPARLPRATKNAAELAGTRAAHRRDGAAVTRYLSWLDRQQPGTIDEVGAVEALEAARRRAGEDAQMPLRDVSFDTISGAGPNGAIIHYRVTRATNRTLGEGELFLVDSGAQYQDGTTDITRTVAIGTPTDEMRQRYTLVLKGLIGISLLRFPVGTRGCDIDPVARLALWQAGLDYGHGTGHGVGSYLSVHEGPQRIARTGTEKLLPGMILSNEPGYYRQGAYGIRLENLIVVRPAEPVPGGEIAMHAFETLTLAPFDRRLIVPSLLTGDESAFLDAYHARVVAEIGPLLDEADRAWLERAAAPL